MLFQHIDDRVQASRALGVTLGIVDLSLEAVLRPALFLKLGMEVDAAVTVRLGLHIDAQFEVDERFIIANIEQMAAWAVGDDRAVFQLPAFGAFIDFPTGHGLAIKQLNETILIRFCGQPDHRCQHHRCGCKKSLHRNIPVFFCGQIVGETIGRVQTCPIQTVVWRMNLWL